MCTAESCTSESECTALQHLFDIVGSLCRGLQKHQAMLLCELFSLLRRHSAPMLQGES